MASFLKCDLKRSFGSDFCFQYKVVGFHYLNMESTATDFEKTFQLLKIDCLSKSVLFPCKENFEILATAKPLMLYSQTFGVLGSI